MCHESLKTFHEFTFIYDKDVDIKVVFVMLSFNKKYFNNNFTLLIQPVVSNFSAILDLSSLVQ